MKRPTWRKWPRRAERGFILVVVLFVVLLMALMAASFTRSVRTYLEGTRTDAELAKARAGADAGALLGLLDLTQARSGAERRFPADGAAVACSYDADTVLTISVEDEAGKVSLNMADEALLSALFTGLGADPAAAAGYADLILDFRDGDRDPRPHGAEAPQYAVLSARGAMGPKDAPFDAIEELDQVAGIPPPLLGAAKPFLSVHSRLAGVDPGRAPGRLARLLSGGGADPEPGAIGANAADFDEGLIPAQFTTRSDQRAFRARAVARRSSGARFEREAILELSDDGSDRFIIRRWRQGEAAEQPPVANLQDLPPC